MALVVFLRAVNVGGHRRFKPSELARDLADFGVTNVGAAGTLVVRKEIDPARLRHEFLRKLPFEAELMICPAEEISELVRSRPFAEAPTEKDVRHFVSVLGNPPQIPPRLPIERPEGDNWEVRVIQVTGRYAFSLWRRRGRSVVYPNEVVERGLEVSATTRGWSTIGRIEKLLDSS